MLTDSPTGRRSVSDHYARPGLLRAIQDALELIGKTEATVTLDDLAPLDEFHIGGRAATLEIMRQLDLRHTDHLLDVGCGLGGPARYAASHFRCRVTGIDLTRDYVEAGNRLCRWLGMSDSVCLREASALFLPFAESSFDGAYMLHVGMNVADKASLFCEIARVLRPGSMLALYDVMRTGEGDLDYPLPWATYAGESAVASPRDYSNTLDEAGFDLVAKRDRRDFAIEYFRQQRTSAAERTRPALGLHILMGEKRQAQLRNMSRHISDGLLAPFEFITRRRA